MRQQRRSGQSAINRPRRHRSFDHALARRASKLGPHMVDNLEAIWNVLQLLAYILVEVLQCAAAIRAARMLGSMSYSVELEMLGRRLPPQRRRPVAGDPGLRLARCASSASG